VIMADGDGKSWCRAKLLELLPRGFGPKDLHSSLSSDYNDFTKA
jgi:hypothetical protein